MVVLGFLLFCVVIGGLVLVTGGQFLLLSILPKNTNATAPPKSLQGSSEIVGGSLVDSINKYRDSNKLQKLNIYSGLSDLAQKQAKYVYQNNDQSDSDFKSKLSNKTLTQCPNQTSYPTELVVLLPNGSNKTADGIINDLIKNTPSAPALSDPKAYIYAVGSYPDQVSYNVGPSQNKMNYEYQGVTSKVAIVILTCEP